MTDYELLFESYKHEFMRPEIYQGDVYLVETSCGTEILPADVIGFWEFNDEDDIRRFASYARDYCEGTIDVDTTMIRERRDVWLARLSAPGYMDATDWCYFDTEDEAIEYLLDYNE